jgi:NADH-quinone oxidoreductase subunit G
VLVFQTVTSRLLRRIESVNNNFMMIDNIPVEINGEKNLLELIRKAGIDIPTFCYHSELSIYGACRMCMVENKWGSMEAACSTPPRAGMEIHTNTPKLRKYRKMILELLLANHCRDCTACGKNGRCKLQELANRYGIRDVRFENTSPEPNIDNSSKCITRDTNKCILCGDCVRVCNEIQNVGAIDFAHRGSKMTVSCAFDEPIAKSNCVGCGQCAAVCPTGAIVIRNDRPSLWNEIYNPEKLVVVQVAPAVRVAVAKEFNYTGHNVMGKIVACLRRMGFDKVFDTVTGADLTVIEEANEFTERLSKGENLPLFTSCCPAWVNYCEKNYPELLPNISTCRSPMQMFASVTKEYFKDCGKRIVNVAIMPCTAKKFEASRDEFKVDGVPNVDYVISTQGLIQLIRETGIVFSEIEPEAVDMPFGSMSGGGVIFGVTGGVTEAVIRNISEDKSMFQLRALEFDGVRGMEGTKEYTLHQGPKDIKIAVVSGLKNADNLIRKIKSGEVHYDLIEVMACPGGCINGGGQPFTSYENKVKRGEELYSIDKMTSIKYSSANPEMADLYNGILKGRSHELLHVHYGKHED